MGVRSDSVNSAEEVEVELGLPNTEEESRDEEEVIEAILENLSVPDKLALRLTCHTTKLWVETNQFLSLFKASISSNDEMYQFVNFAKTFPTTKWRCVAFPEKNITGFTSFPSFVSLFSNFITTLHLKEFNGGLAEILFICSCEIIQHFKIDEMDLRRNPMLVVTSDKTLKAKCPKLLDIFTEIKSFQIGIILFNEIKQLSFYQTFLQKCRKLVKLNVPRTQGPPTISWEALKGIQLRSLIGPIGEYLRKKPVTNPMKTDLQVLDVGGLFSRHFPAVAEVLVQISAPTLFEHVNEKHVKYLFSHEGDILQRILSLKEKIDDRRPIEKWTRLEQLYIRSSRCDIRFEYPHLIACPNLKILTIVMDSKSREDPNFQMLRRLIKLVFVEREKLKEFTLQWPLFSHDTPQDYIRAGDFVGNFGNLTKLHVSGWGVPDSDFILMFNVLGKLKVLILEECRGLTDFGLIGEPELDQPVLMNLKNLTKLEIRNRNCRGILTDEVFSRALMHMRLQHLLIESFHVTIKGYEYLANGLFKWTIRRLPTPQTLPRGISNGDEFVQLIAEYFPNIIF